MTDEAIRIDQISKVYRLYQSPSGRLKEALSRGRINCHQDYWALKDISISIRKGTTIGIVGRNGSGKSTLLQIIAGILTPTAGSIQVNGRISALLELGSGFDPEFSGRENVYLNGAILGLSREEIDKRFADIETFANIGRYMEQPVKLYSSGMYVRLAFATAVNVDPDILLVDEALSVGDVLFQHRCMRKIREIQELGKTIIFVSHDIGAVRKLCTEAVLIEKGCITSMGNPDHVIQAYYKTIWGADEAPIADSEMSGASSGESHQLEETADLEPLRHYDHRFGNRRGEVVAVGLLDERGNRVDTITGGKRLFFSLLIKCHRQVDMPLVGFMVKDLLGNELIVTNTDAEGHFLEACPAGVHIRVTFSFVMPRLKVGSYAISAGFGNGTIEHHKAYDWIDNIVVFSLESSDQFFGMIQTRMDVEHRLTHD